MIRCTTCLLDLQGHVCLFVRGRDPDSTNFFGQQQSYLPAHVRRACGLCLGWRVCHSVVSRAEGRAGLAPMTRGTCNTWPNSWLHLRRPSWKQKGGAKELAALYGSGMFNRGRERPPHCISATSETEPPNKNTLLPYARPRSVVTRTSETTWIRLTTP
jgi:hypothetical protein